MATLAQRIAQRVAAKPTIKTAEELGAHVEVLVNPAQAKFSQRRVYKGSLDAADTVSVQLYVPADFEGSGVTMEWNDLRSAPTDPRQPEPERLSKDGRVAIFEFEDGDVLMVVHSRQLNADVETWTATLKD